MKRHDLNKKIKKIDKLESKTLRRIEQLQRNVLELRSLRVQLEALMVTPASNLKEEVSNAPKGD